MASKTECWDKFTEYLEVAEKSSKQMNTRLLYAQLAEIYYRLWEKAIY